MKKRIIAMLPLLLLILISGCLTEKGKTEAAKKTLEEIRAGAEGIVISFLPNAPPDKIHVAKGEKSDFEVVLELKNKGAYPQPNEGVITSGTTSTQGGVYISGFDPNIIIFTPKLVDLSSLTLEGKSTINPKGGLDLVTFNGKVDVGKLNVEKYEPTLLATICYDYDTVAGPAVCIDPNPYSTIKEKKVCEVKDITLSSQGAPVAVTKIEEEALASKTQFKITIKNVGNGDVIKFSARDKCNPFHKEKLVREDVDKVLVGFVSITDKSLICGPFVDGAVKAESGYVRLINNEGFIICEYPITQYRASKSAFLTPLTIRLGYVYRSTAEKKVQIKQETSSSTGGSFGISSGITPSEPTPEGVPPSPFDR